MRVLSVASECAPLVKTGGLADVVGALPGALAPLGVEMHTLLPGYPSVLATMKKAKTLLKLPDLFGGPATLRAATLSGLDMLILDAPHLFDRPGAPYHGAEGDWPDNAERFAALSHVAAEIAGGALKDWQPDILHAHDWQAGFAPLYLRENHPKSKTGTVLTIHNVAFQGLASKDKIDALKLPQTGMQPGGFEYWDQISSLKAGMNWADRITTVSPTYAGELLTPEFGMGLDGVLRDKRDILSGILNGIDTESWTPPYKTPAGKARFKTKLRKYFDLPDSAGPLAVVVSRLTEQKGLDVLLEALPRLLDEGGQLALLGSGDPALEAAFQQAAKDNANVAVEIGYNETLAHLLIEGGDAILVPSRFEPCGLTQLYGLRYGTIPVVAYTGGLADTVIPTSPAGLRARVATGIQFHPVTADAMSRALDRLCSHYRDRDLWLTLQKNAMRHPVGWESSAAEYKALYADILKD